MKVSKYREPPPLEGTCEGP